MPSVRYSIHKPSELIKIKTKINYTLKPIIYKTAANRLFSAVEYLK